MSQLTYYGLDSTQCSAASSARIQSGFFQQKYMCMIFYAFKIQFGAQIIKSKCTTWYFKQRVSV